MPLRSLLFILFIILFLVLITILIPVVTIILWAPAAPQHRPVYDVSAVGRADHFLCFPPRFTWAFLRIWLASRVFARIRSHRSFSLARIARFWDYAAVENGSRPFSCWN